MSSTHLMLRLIARLSSPMRAKPSRFIALLTMLRNFFAARGQESASVRHRVRISRSWGNSLATALHLFCRSPDTSAEVTSPNGSGNRLTGSSRNSSNGATDAVLNSSGAVDAILYSNASFGSAAEASSACVLPKEASNPTLSPTANNDVARRARCEFDIITPLRWGVFGLDRPILFPVLQGLA